MMRCASAVAKEGVTDSKLPERRSSIRRVDPDQGTEVKLQLSEREPCVHRVGIVGTSSCRSCTSA